MSQTATLPASTLSTGRYHWTVDAFYRAIDAGVFEEPNVLELVRGEIWKRDKMNPPHATVTTRIARRMRDLFEPNFCIREEKPIHLAFDGEPVPDVLVANGSHEDYEERHPVSENIRLLVEVADTSVDRDTREKALLYAQAGIPDYWVVLLNARQVLVHRQPTPEGYPDPRRLLEDDTVTPLFAPDVTIAVADLLPRRAAADENLSR